MVFEKKSINHRLSLNLLSVNRDCNRLHCIHISLLHLSCFKVYCTNITQNIFPISLMQLVFEARKGGIVGLCFSRYMYIYYIYVIIRLLHANHGQFGKWKNPHASSAFIPNLQSITNIISLSFSLVIRRATRRSTWILGTEYVHKVVFLEKMKSLPNGY
jgi:hypothetical protein